MNDFDDVYDFFLLDDAEFSVVGDGCGFVVFCGIWLVDWMVRWVWLGGYC